MKEMITKLMIKMRAIMNEMITKLMLTMKLIAKTMIKRITKTMVIMMMMIEMTTITRMIENTMNDAEHNLHLKDVSG